MTSTVKLWKENLQIQHKRQLETLSKGFPKINSITININNTCEELFKAIVEDPIAAENAIYTALMELRCIPGFGGQHYAINIKFIGFPKRSMVKELNSKTLEKFVSVRVSVKKITSVKPRVVRARFKCQSCKEHYKEVPVDDEEIIPPSETCICGKRNWKLILKESVKKDYQVIQVQDPPEDGEGTKPEILTVRFLDDLAGKVQPGNIIVINGVYSGKLKKNGVLLDTFLDAKSLEIKNRDFSKIEILPDDEAEIVQLAKDPEIYDKLWQSIATSIKGHEYVKQAILLYLFGGVEKTNEDGETERGDLHVLICGDPGIAKSKMLKAAYLLCPRGVYASGKATTAAGLTAAVGRSPDGGWEIEAGAAVLADKGNLFLDELDKVDKGAVESLHEIMEEQVLHINKAGINTDLSTNEAILAAANPKRSRFDKCMDLASQVNFPASLLSRFGLVFLLLDEPNEKMDREISRHMLQSHRGTLSKGKISAKLVRKYIAYSKQTCMPELTDESAQLIEDYYVKVRSKHQGAIPITPRQQQDIVRLCEASAKTRLSSVIERIDIERAIRIYEEAMKFTMDPITGQIDVDRASGNMSSAKREALVDIKSVRNEMHDSTGEWPGRQGLIAEMCIRGMDVNTATDAVNTLFKELGIAGYV